jgi:hypothetical protein
VMVATTQPADVEAVTDLSDGTIPQNYLDHVNKRPCLDEVGERLAARLTTAG